MDGPLILEQTRQRLAEIVGSTTPSLPEVLDVSPWVAMSLLQKAIRRGESSHAQNASATLLRTAPERLWRRLGAIAYEDIGVGSIETVFGVTCALGGKRLRAKWGGEWRTASALVRQMTLADKCRAADDLLIAAERHPQYSRARCQFSGKSLGELIRIATGTANLPVRAIAAWYAIGTDRRPSPFLEKRIGSPGAFFDALRECGYPHTVVAVASEGFRRLGEVLCPFTAMLARDACAALKELQSDQLPGQVLIRGVPGWSYDVYTREGQEALRQYLRSDAQGARWMRRHVPAQSRVRFLGDIVFRIEGGLVTNRLSWRVGLALRQLVDEGCYGPPEIFDLMRQDLPALNEVRADVC